APPAHGQAGTPEGFHIRGCRARVGSEPPANRRRPCAGGWQARHFARRGHSIAASHGAYGSRLRCADR
ncbi:hypothetical protein ABTG43_18535, partial [Acinetobacter baumannii]